MSVILIESLIDSEVVNNCNNKISHLKDAISAIRNFYNNSKKDSNDTEVYSEYLEEIFKNHSVLSTEKDNCTEKSFKCLYFSNLMHLLSDIPIHIIRLIFNFLNGKQRKYLLLEDFLKLGSLKTSSSNVIIELILKLLDVNREGVIKKNNARIVLDLIKSTYTLPKELEKLILFTCFDNNPNSLNFSEINNYCAMGKNINIVNFLNESNTSSAENNFIILIYAYLYENLLINPNYVKTFKSSYLKKSNSIIIKSRTEKEKRKILDNPLKFPKRKTVNMEVTVFKKELELSAITQISNKGLDLSNLVSTKETISKLDCKGLTNMSSNDILDSKIENKELNLLKINQYCNLFNNDALYNNKSYQDEMSTYACSYSQSLEKTDEVPDFINQEKDKIIEELTRSIKIESYVNITNRNKCQINKDNYRKIVLINTCLYVYYVDELDNKENSTHLFEYLDCKYLKGSYIIANKNTRTCILGKTYYSLTIQYPDTTEDIIYHEDRQVIMKWITNLREAIGYRNFFDRYSILYLISEGSFGKIHVGKDIFNISEAAKPYAIKILKKENIELVRNEIDTMRLLKHNNIINFYDVFDNSTYYFIVMDYLPNGDLKSFLKKVDYKLKEKTIASIIFQIAQGLKYLYNNNIIHRDIKPENILISDLSKESIKVKIADFGLCKSLNYNETTNDACGSIPFTAPEILLRSDYSYSADVWSFGIILYNILSGGEYPFKISKDINKTASNIVYQDLNFSDKLKKYSIYANDLIERCLVRDIEKRIKIDEIVKHPWFTSFS